MSSQDNRGRDLAGRDSFPRFHSVILKFYFHAPSGTVSVARRTLADVWVGRLHPALDRDFSDSAGPRAGRPAGFRREIAVAAHPAAARAVHARHRDRPGLLGRPGGRPAANPQVLRVPRTAGGLLHSARPQGGPLAVPDLGGHRQPDRHPRVRPVRRQGAGGPPGGPRLLRFLRGRAHHRLHQPLEHLLRRGDVRPHHARRFPVLRRHAQAVPGSG